MSSIKHEKIVRRENGLRLKIEVFLIVDEWGRLIGDNKIFEYSSCVQACDKGKRKFRQPLDSERPSREEIHSAKLELWQLIKPELNR